MSILIALCSVFVMSIGQEQKVLAAENVFKMTPGGSIRIAKPYGLRFQVKMSADVKEKADKVGMLIFPADYLVDNGTDGDVYYESVEALANTTISSHRIKLDLTDKIYEKDDYWYGNGVIVNIKGKNMSRDFVGIAYYETNDEIVLMSQSVSYLHDQLKNIVSAITEQADQLNNSNREFVNNFTNLASSALS